MSLTPPYAAYKVLILASPYIGLTDAAASALSNVRGTRYVSGSPGFIVQWFMLLGILPALDAALTDTNEARRNLALAYRDWKDLNAGQLATGSVDYGSAVNQGFLSAFVAAGFTTQAQLDAFNASLQVPSPSPAELTLGFLSCTADVTYVRNN